MRRLLAWGLAAVAIGLGPGAGVALGHGESSPTIVTLVDEVAPATEGLEVAVRPGAAARLTAVNETGDELEVLGFDGEPFLRIGPGGTFANVNHIDWYRSGNPDGRASPPDDADIGGDPRYERVSRESEWAWFDHRLHPGEVQVSDEAFEAQRTARLDDWTVPLRLGGEEAEVRGHVEFRPLLGAVVAELRSPMAVSDDVQVTLLTGRLPGLLLLNLGREPVTVIGRDGEPFARIGPQGVEVNLRSTTHVEDQIAKGKIASSRASVASDPAAAPRWRKVSSQNSYAWLDTRASYPRERPPREISEGRRRVELQAWSVPLETASGRVDVEGATSWVPFRQTVAVRPGGGGMDTGWIVGGGLAALLALGGAVGLRRRRAERPEPFDEASSAAG